MPEDLIMLVAAKLGVPELPSRVEAFCRRWRVRELAFFGSLLRDDFAASSDVDVLVTFDVGARPTLLTLAAMEAELSRLLGRSVDILERGGVEETRNPFRRGEILKTARVAYAG